MKDVWVCFTTAILLLALFSNAQSLAAVLGNPSEEGAIDLSFDRVRNFTLNDGLPFSEKAVESEYTETPVDTFIAVRESSDPGFDYMAASPYYKVFFKGTLMRMNVQDAWVELQLPEQNLGEIQNVSAVPEENSLSVSDVFESVDLSFTVESSLLAEAITLKELKHVDRIELGISWEGVTPEFQEDGSILFSDEDGREVLKILPPFMKDAEGSICGDVHYELVETESGYELHKVIEEKGLEWLETALYPVVIDPSMQTFEDAWESSGFAPYGQYFQNLNEYVNPANGHLIIKYTDLVIPGRGLNLAISRTYETLAVFYQAEPYDYSAPPVNVGKGWRLDFPYIGGDYLYSWGGTIYKIEWIGNTFENHIGDHFILVKNGDSTYTLTMANGNIYEFDTSGTLTQYKDLDQNTITFSYDGNGKLQSITDTIGRTATFSYSDGHLWKITYNGAELEYGYDGNGNLTWIEDFLNRRTSFYYNSGWFEWFDYGSGYAQRANVYLLSKIAYPTGGFTTYSYDRFSYEDVYGDDGTPLDYYKYYVTNQRAYETNQVRHTEYTYTGNFSQITSSAIVVKNESDISKGSFLFSIDSLGLISQRVVKNASGIPLQKYEYTYNSKKQVITEKVYNDGANLSYTSYCAYDDWGNVIYTKNAEGHEIFFSYANTSTSGFFVDNTGTVIRQFTNAFSNSTVPSTVHTALLGLAERQDGTFVREVYRTYDAEEHPTQSDDSFGDSTSWLTFSGTFNEKTGSTSFPIDLTGHTVTGNAVLQVTGLPSDTTYQESHSYECPCNPSIQCTWNPGSWSGKNYSVHWMYCGGIPPECDDGWASVGPFTHYPGTLGYLSYTTNPPLGGKSHTFTVTTNWKAYPAQVQYNIDQSSWKIVTSNLQNATANVPVTISSGSHTLYFSESSSYQTKLSWYLYVPVDNILDTYTTTMTYDAYGNFTSIADAESNTVNFIYSSTYSSAYLTEISAAVGSDTITTKATYDYYRGWITSIQDSKGVAAEQGYDNLYYYDLLGRITKKEFPLLSGQSQRSFIEAVYDDVNRTVTTIDQQRHYTVREYDKLGRHITTKWYTGTYGSGTLYATTSFTHQYNDLVSSRTDPGNDTYAYIYDFLGRCTQVSFPDSTSDSYSYDDTYNKVTFTNKRGFEGVYWKDWLNRLTKVEEEYATGLFAVTTYQYDEAGHVISFTDAENNTTSYTYDSLFGITKITYPDSTYEEYEYDNVGNIILFTDAKGNEVLFTYDSAYRLIEIEYEDQSSVSFTYDLNCNKIRMEDDAPNTGDYIEYTFDEWNRLTSETRHMSQDAYTIFYQYDVANRLTGLTYPDSMQILYSYDDLDRVTEIRRYVDGVNDEILTDNFQYDTESLLTQFDYGNGLRAAFSYDSRDRYSTIDVEDSETSYLDLDYTYDNNSNIIQSTNGWRDASLTWHSDTESYSYDGLDRLISASCTSWSHTYSYDKVGNRTAKDGVTYTINAVNEVTALSDGTSFTYDANGNRTEKTKGSDTWTYTFDYENRLTRVEKNETTLAEYVYDGGGKRLQVVENGETTTYFFMGFDVLFEKKASSAASYIYGPMGRLAKRTTYDGESHTFYYHLDSLESTRLVTDENRNVVSSVTYHPFGVVDAQDGSEEHLFTGKQKDSTGLYYYGRRYYDPDLGRFLTRDLLGGRTIAPQTLNRYSYCLNNPLKFIDPDGAESINSGYPGYHKKWKTTKSIYNGNEEYAWVEYNYGEGFLIVCVGCGAVLLAIAITCVATGSLTLAAKEFIAWLNPALSGWITAHATAIKIANAIIWLINLIMLCDLIWQKIKDHLTPDECLDFLAALQKYCEDAGLDLDGATIKETYPDGSITVQFPDGSTQTFGKKGDCYVPIPTPPDDEQPSESNKENETEEDSSSGLSSNNYGMV